MPHGRVAALRRTDRTCDGNAESARASGSSANRVDLQHLVAIVIDDLDGDLACLRFWGTAADSWSYTSDDQAASSISARSTRFRHAYFLGADDPYDKLTRKLSWS